MAPGTLANVNAFASLVSGASPPTVLAVTRHVAGWSAVKVAPDIEHPFPVTANNTGPVPNPPDIVSATRVSIWFVVTAFDTVKGVSLAAAGPAVRHTKAAAVAATISASPLSRAKVNRPVTSTPDGVDAKPPCNKAQGRHIADMNAI